jgi:hypothetical protein
MHVAEAENEDEYEAVVEKDADEKEILEAEFDEDEDEEYEMDLTEGDIDRVLEEDDIWSELIRRTDERMSTAEDWVIQFAFHISHNFESELDAIGLEELDVVMITKIVIEFIGVVRGIKGLSTYQLVHELAGEDFDSDEITKIIKMVVNDYEKLVNEFRKAAHRIGIPNPFSPPRLAFTIDVDSEDVEKNFEFAMFRETLEIGDVLRIIGFYKDDEVERRVVPKLLRGKKLIRIPDSRQLWELESTDIVLTEYYRTHPRRKKAVKVVVDVDESAMVDDISDKDKQKGKKAKDKGKAKGKKGKSKRGKKK